MVPTPASGTVVYCNSHQQKDKRQQCFAGTLSPGEPRAAPTHAKQLPQACRHKRRVTAANTMHSACAATDTA